MKVDVQVPEVQELLRKLINRHEGHAIPVSEDDELTHVDRLPRVEGAAEGDLSGQQIQHDLQKHRDLAVGDKYLKRASVLEFVKITKVLSTRSRTQLLKWARCHFPKAQEVLPAGEWILEAAPFSVFCFCFLNLFSVFVFDNIDAFRVVRTTDDRTLQRHIKEVQKPILKYQEEVKFDLSKWNVKPSKVTMKAWNPMFRIIECLPLPPARQGNEDLQTYINRSGPCPQKVWWEHFVCSNGRGDRTFTGHAASGMYMTKAMQTTPAGSYPLMIEYSEDGVPLNTHCQYRGVGVSKACACALVEAYLVSSCI